jgi:hypothetical protein
VYLPGHFDVYADTPKKGATIETGTDPSLRDVITPSPV